jgi:hypothetical protein
MDKYDRALQIWQVLISAAHNRQILTYEIVAELIGLGRQGAIAIGPAYLGILKSYCIANRLPPITALIVKKKGGKPGAGLSDALTKHPDEDREKVFTRQWFKMKPLTRLDLGATAPSKTGP